MKTSMSRRLIHAVLILFMAVAVLISASPQTAQAQETTPIANNTYIIPVPLPKLDEIDLSAARIDLDQSDPEWVNRLTAGLLVKEAKTILETLRRLQDSGVIEHYEVLTDTTAIRVTLAEENNPKRKLEQ